MLNSVNGGLNYKLTQKKEIIGLIVQPTKENEDLIFKVVI